MPEPNDFQPILYQVAAAGLQPDAHKKRVRLDGSELLSALTALKACPITP